MTREQRQFDMTWYYVTLVLILLLVLSPFILVLGATVLADANGCQFDEGSLQRCPGALYTMGRLGALIMPAVPIGLLALAIWLVVLIVSGVVWSRRQGGV